MERNSRSAAAADRLKPYSPDLIATSCEHKARHTAEIVAGELGKPLMTFDGLHEHDRAGTPIWKRKSSIES